MRTQLTLASVALLWGALAQAGGNIANLEEGLPTSLEDAYPTAYLNLEGQLALGYRRTAADEDKLLLHPRLEVGFARNWQVRLGAPFTFDVDSIERTDGRLGLEIFYNFNTEDIVWPAFALSGRLSFPLGLESEGVDSELKLLITKTIIRQVRGQLHLNVTWQHLYHTPGPGEEEDGYVVIVGYSQRLLSSLALIVDFVREETIREGTQNIFEGGLRFQATPLTALSLGVAAGIEEDSDRVRVTLAIQHSFAD